MSGSPVYIDGKLVGAVALRLSVILAGRDLRHHARSKRCWRLRISTSRGPEDARTPDRIAAASRQAVAARRHCQAIMLATIGVGRGRLAQPDRQ
jgi:hypothetical protein